MANSKVRVPPDDEKPQVHLDVPLPRAAASRLPDTLRGLRLPLRLPDQTTPVVISSVAVGVTRSSTYDDAPHPLCDAAARALFGQPAIIEA